jgi:hypothetical protein
VSNICFVRPGELCSIALMGSSAMVFSEVGRLDAVPQLVERTLAEMRPATSWRCSADLLHPAPTMAGRAVAIVERVRPRAVVIWLSGVPFAEDFVVYAIRNRWPRLYQPMQVAATKVRQLAGGGTEGAETPRGWLFRVPRNVARTFTGAAPQVTVDAAEAFVTDTLAALAGIEELAIVCRLAVPVFYHADDRRETRRRVAHFNEAITRVCVERYVPFYDPVQLVAEKGHAYGMAQDQIHSDLPTRKLEAERIASLLLGQV